MRPSLKASLAEHGGETFRYPKGSIVLCNACAVPVAKLEQGVNLGDKTGRLVTAFVPLTTADLDTLAGREDIDAGVRAWVNALTPDARQTYLGNLHEFRTGDPMLCPTCQGCFVQVISVEKDAVLDKSYVIELVTLPPMGHKVTQVRGRQLGYYKDWLHEHAGVVH